MIQKNDARTEKSISFTFNKRYLVVDILIYITAAYIAINCSFLPTYKKALSLYTFIFVLIIISISSVLWILFRKRRNERTLIFSSLASVLIFIVGFTISSSHIYTLDMKREIIESHPRIWGTVKGTCEYSNSGTSLALTVDVHMASDGNGSVTFDKPCLVKIYVPVDTFEIIPSHGDSIAATLSISEDTGPAFEGGFDYLRQLRQSKIACFGYSYNTKSYSPLPAKNPFMFKFESLGLKIQNLVLKSTELPGYDTETSALLKGILVGKTDGISDDLYSNLKSSGFIHIASVSGMHTSYLFMAITLLLGLMRLPRRIICLTAMPFMILFAAVAQFSPSVCRSVVMMIILLAATVLKRNNDSITALAVAALILVINNPYTLESYGALMSFGATLGILVYFPLLSKKMSFAVMNRPTMGFRRPTLKFLRLNTLYRLNKFVIDSICLSYCATLGLSYFMMRFYGYLQWGSIFGNIPIFPLVAIAFIGGYINCMIQMISPAIAGIVAKYIINPSLLGVIKLAEFFSADIFIIKTPSPPKSFFVVYIVICILIYHFLKPSKSEQVP